MGNIKNIVLTGFMMAGKSVIGKELADITGFEFVDTDDMIIQTEKKQIGDIFSEKGEEYFRNVESRIALEVARKQNAVISTGGGMVLRKQNMEALGKTGVVVNLKITPEVIKKRLDKEKSTRPVIKNSDMNEVLEKLKSRECFYNKCDYSITVSDKKSPRELAEEILEILKRNGEI